MAAIPGDPFSSFASGFGASFGAGLAGPDPSTSISSGSQTIKSLLDGSGWTVSTGRATATGADQRGKLTDFGNDTQAPPPSIGGDGSIGLQSAGLSPLLSLGLVMILAGLVLRAKKGA
jgi:hypothetical protein